VNPANWGLIGLGVVGMALIVLAALSRRPVAGLILPTGIADYAQIWKELHHADDVEPLKNPLHVAYLRVTYGAATPLARLGVLPDVLTLVGLWLAGIVLALGALGGRWPILAGVLMVLSSLTDGVDGAVAGLTDRATARGHVLDSVVDRIAEVCFVGAVMLAGAPAWAGVLAYSGIMLLEYTRARASSAGPTGEVGVLTIGERPTRVIGCTLSLIAMGIAPQSTVFIGRTSLLIVAAASFIGFVQLAWYIGRRFASPR
jgi:phosphatidylglycerophosphate synthase